MILAKPWLATTARQTAGKIVCVDKDNEFLPVPQSINKDLFISELSNNKFFYKIKCFHNKKPKYQESGVARLKGDVLERLEFFECYEYGRKANRPSNREFADGDTFCISSYYPEQIPLENCLLTSDGVLQLGSAEVLTTDSYKDIVEYIQNSKKPLELKTVCLTPSSRPVKPKTGTLLYNKRSGRLEIWDGSNWLEIT